MGRFLLFGKNGQLGWELQRTLITMGEVSAFDYPEIDLGKPESIREIIREKKPQMIINAAAYTNVDKAESEPDLAMNVNAIAPGIMAEEAKRLDIALIHYSTDYVFDGKKGSPYVETDQVNPLNVYGKTKLEGERAVESIGGAYLIFRTSWVFSQRGNGFVSKVLQWARQQEILRVVDDQIGNPTWARLLAEATSQIIAQGKEDPTGYIQAKSGLYHLAGHDACSRYDWARLILDHNPDKKDVRVKQIVPAKTDEFPLPATRPMTTAMNSSKAEKTFGVNCGKLEDVMKLLF